MSIKNLLGSPGFVPVGPIGALGRIVREVVTVWVMSSVVVIKSFVFRRANDAVSP